MAGSPTHLSPHFFFLNVAELLFSAGLVWVSPKCVQLQGQWAGHTQTQALPAGTFPGRLCYLQHSWFFFSGSSQWEGYRLFHVWAIATHVILHRSHLIPGSRWVWGEKWRAWKAMQGNQEIILKEQRHWNGKSCCNAMTGLNRVNAECQLNLGVHTIKHIL